MARTKAKSEAEAGKAGEGQTPPETGNGVNKMQAVRRALSKLGMDAKPAEIREYIRKRFGVDMSPQMISNYKTIIAKRAGETGRRRGRPSAAAGSGSSAQAARATGGEVSLGDIQAVKDLVDRLGAAKVHKLTDVLNR